MTAIDLEMLEAEAKKGACAPGELLLDLITMVRERDAEIESLEHSYRDLHEYLDGKLVEMNQLRAELEACRKTKECRVELCDGGIFHCAKPQLEADLQISRDQAERYRVALEKLQLYVSFNGDTWVQETAREALSPDGRPSEMLKTVEKLLDADERIFKDKESDQ